LAFHRVLHHVDAAAGVLGKPERAPDANDDEVARDVRLADVLHRDRLWKPAGRPYDDNRWAQLDTDRGAGRLVAAMGEGVGKRLTKYDLLDARRLVASCVEDDHLDAEFVVDAVDCALKDATDGSTDLLAAV
jgi:hypothetical protein